MNREDLDYVATEQMPMPQLCAWLLNSNVAHHTGYVWKERDVEGRVTALWPLSVERVTAVTEGYVYRAVSREPVFLPEHDVIEINLYRRLAGLFNRQMQDSDA